LFVDRYCQVVVVELPLLLLLFLRPSGQNLTQLLLRCPLAEGDDFLPLA
jgi:hypothetical protein